MKIPAARGSYMLRKLKKLTGIIKIWYKSLFEKPLAGKWI